MDSITIPVAKKSLERIADERKLNIVSLELKKTDYGGRKAHLQFVPGDDSVPEGLRYDKGQSLFFEFVDDLIPALNPGGSLSRVINVNPAFNLSGFDGCRLPSMVAAISYGLGVIEDFVTEFKMQSASTIPHLVMDPLLRSFIPEVKDWRQKYATSKESDIFYRRFHLSPDKRYRFYKKGFRWE